MRHVASEDCQLNMLGEGQQKNRGLRRLHDVQLSDLCKEVDERLPAGYRNRGCARNKRVRSFVINKQIN
jgi:hypothetical protein